MQKRPKLIYLLAGMMFLTLACGPCSLLSADLPTPPRAIAVSTDSAAQLESRIQQNLGGPTGQPFIMSMTDAEVTSLVATKLAEYGDSPVADPQIWFTKGKIYGTGRLVNVLPIETKFFVVASARIEDGQVKVEIEESSAGALPIPSRMLDTISQSINETMDDLQLDVTVSALEILEGEAIIKGTRE